MSTQHPEGNYNPGIDRLAHEMLTACRDNIDLYTSPSGIKITIGTADWGVSYWPASAANGEALYLLKDREKLENPAAYRVLPPNIRKNEVVAERHGAGGGISLDPNGEVLLFDVAEARTLKAIVQAAHRIKSSLAEGL